jgi:YidC/Oxa1 family membrane protein insertase
LGGPWWLTIVSCTLAFRIALVPVMLSQIRARASHSVGPVGEHIRLLNKNLANESQKRSPKTKRALTMTETMTYLKDLIAIFRRFKVNPLSIVAVPVIQVCVFITYMWAARDLLAHGGLDLSNQGFLWFTDLSVKDPTLILPFAAALTSYTLLEISFKRIPVQRSKAKPRFGDTVRELIQVSLTFGFPIIAQFPAGIFMYWLPSSLFALTQAMVLRKVKMRQILGLIPQRPSTEKSTSKTNTIENVAAVSRREAKSKT